MPSSTVATRSGSPSALSAVEAALPPTSIARAKIVGFVPMWPATPRESGESHAFLYTDGKMFDLNSLVDASVGWTLLGGTAINDSGQIAGVGVGPDGKRCERSSLVAPRLHDKETGETTKRNGSRRPRMKGYRALVVTRSEKRIQRRYAGIDIENCFGRRRLSPARFATST